MMLGKSIAQAEARFPGSRPTGNNATSIVTTPGTIVTLNHAPDTRRPSK
jgi:hypothetical protein